MKDLSSAQADMRLAYLFGAPGMFTSAAAWLAAATTAQVASPKQAVWVLFVGGALIHPISTLLCRALGRSGKHSPGNPLAPLAFATTLWMIFCLPLVYGASLLRIEWFFPAMLLVIGGRYLTFSLLFGLRLYWVIGLALAVAGYLLGKATVAPAWSGFTGAAIEALFATVMLIAGLREVRANNSFKPKRSFLRSGGHPEQISGVSQCQSQDQEPPIAIAPSSRPPRSA
jgi:hypothetical protein